MIHVATQGMDYTFICQTDDEDNTAHYLWFHAASDLLCSQSNCSDGVFTFNATDTGIVAEVYSEYAKNVKIYVLLSMQKLWV